MDRHAAAAALALSAVLLGACATPRGQALGADPSLRPRAHVGAATTVVRLARPAHVALVRLSDGGHATLLHTSGAERLAAGSHSLVVPGLTGRAHQRGARNPCNRPGELAQRLEERSPPAAFDVRTVPGTRGIPVRCYRTPESVRATYDAGNEPVVLLASAHPLPPADLEALVAEFNQRPRRASEGSAARALAEALAFGAEPEEWAAYVFEVR